MYSFSIRQFIWEYIGFFFGGKVPLCIRFQLGNSFGKYIGGFFWRESSLMYLFSIRQIHLGMHRCFFFWWKVPLCTRFQLGNSFRNTWSDFFYINDT